jgi:hypothetical protein
MLWLEEEYLFFAVWCLLWTEYMVSFFLLSLLFFLFTCVEKEKIWFDVEEWMNDKTLEK